MKMLQSWHQIIFERDQLMRWLKTANPSNSFPKPLQKDWHDKLGVFHANQISMCLDPVRLAPLNRFKPSSKLFYWPFQGGTSFVDLLCFCSVLCLLCFVRVCLYVLRGHLLGKGWPLGSRLWCLLWVCHFPIGILGQVWYLIVSIPDLCNLTYFVHFSWKKKTMTKATTAIISWQWYY